MKKWICSTKEKFGLEIKSWLLLGLTINASGSGEGSGGCYAHEQVLREDEESETETKTKAGTAGMQRVGKGRTFLKNRKEQSMTGGQNQNLAKVGQNLEEGRRCQF